MSSGVFSTKRRRLGGGTTKFVEEDEEEDVEATPGEDATVRLEANLGSLLAAVGDASPATPAHATPALTQHNASSPRRHESVQNLFPPVLTTRRDLDARETALSRARAAEAEARELRGTVAELTAAKEWLVSELESRKDAPRPLETEEHREDHDAAAAKEADEAVKAELATARATAERLRADRDFYKRRADALAEELEKSSSEAARRRREPAAPQTARPTVVVRPDPADAKTILDLRRKVAELEKQKQTSGAADRERAAESSYFSA